MAWNKKNLSPPAILTDQPPPIMESRHQVAEYSIYSLQLLSLLSRRLCLELEQREKAAVVWRQWGLKKCDSTILFWNSFYSMWWTEAASSAENDNNNRSSFRSGQIRCMDDGSLWLGKSDHRSDWLIKGRISKQHDNLLQNTMSGRIYLRSY